MSKKRELTITEVLARWEAQVEWWEIHVKMRMRRHAKRRCRERLGFALTKNVRGNIVSQMLSGRAKFLSVRGVRTRWLVKLQGQIVKVVFDERWKEVVTLWPWLRSGELGR